MNAIEKKFDKEEKRNEKIRKKFAEKEESYKANMEKNLSFMKKQIEMEKEIEQLNMKGKTDIGYFSERINFDY